MKRKQLTLAAGAAVLSLTVLLTVVYALLSGMFQKTEASYTPPTDIEGFAKEAILAVTKAGLMTTTLENGELLFHPEKEVTRGELAEILVRLLKSDTAPYSETPLGFADENEVPTAQLAAVRTVIKLGYLKLHHDRTFRADLFMTREETADIVGALILGEISSGKSESFSDFDEVSAHFLKKAKKAVDYGIMIGYPDGTFRPKNDLTRGELALILHRLLENEHLLQRNS